MFFSNKPHKNFYSIIQTPKKYYNLPTKNSQINYFSIPKLLITGIPVIISKFINENLFAHSLYFFLKNNGFAYMKIGQWLASRPDLFSQKVINKLKLLHQNAPEHPLKYSIMILQKECPQAQLHSLIGSGCVAQTYKGEFDNKEVAIKILHPQIENKILNDLNVISKIFSFIDLDIINQFRIDVLNQINMKNEFYNLKIIRNNFYGYRKVKIPEPLFYTKNILIEEYVNAHDLSKENIDIDKLIFICQNIICKMIFKDKFVHCDLHPGNVKTLNGKIVLFDMGMCRSISKKEHKNLLDLLYEVLYTKDYKKAAELIVTRNKKNKNVDIEKFKEDVVCDLKKRNVLMAVNKHKVKLDYNYSTILTSLTCLDGILKNMSKDPYKSNLKVLCFHIPFLYYMKKIILNE